MIWNLITACENLIEFSAKKNPLIGSSYPLIWVSYDGLKHGT